MTSSRFLILGFLLATSACSVVPLDRGASTHESVSYTVSGTATVNAVQDLADLTVVLTGDASTPKAAAAEVRALKAAFDAAIDASDVPLTDRAVSSLRLSPVYEPVDSRGIRQRLAGYEATHTVTLTLTDFDGLPELMEVAAASGATRVHSAFRVADRPALKRQARELAAKAARQKAQSMTALLGVNLGPIRSIQETDGGGYGLDNNIANYAHNEVVANVASGTHGQTSGVTVTVTLTY